jgi:hypothetical protein
LIIASLLIYFEAFEKLENSFPQCGLLLLLSAWDGVFEVLPIDVPFLAIFGDEVRFEFGETGGMIHGEPMKPIYYKCIGFLNLLLHK